MLETLFASAARVAVLKVFVVDPARSYYQRQLEAVTGLAIRGIQRELERLESIRLLFSHREGNRMYYQIDTQHPLFGDLRSMVLKTANDAERLRAALAAEPAVRMALHDRATERLVIVIAPGMAEPESAFAGMNAETIAHDDFARRLSREPESVAAIVAGCEDVLGRRDDVLWRRLEAAGYDLPKGEGVP